MSDVSSIAIWNKTIAIVQSDATEYGPSTSYGGWLRGCYVMTAGDVKITTWDGVVETWTCPAGFFIPRYIKILWATGTTPTDANLFSGL